MAVSLENKQTPKMSSFRTQYFRFAFLLFLSILLLFVLYKHGIHGDEPGREYLGMTISFANHGTPNLTMEDIRERSELFKLKCGQDLPPEYDHDGYFRALNGKEYCYHFWFYSLLAALPFVILKVLGTNPLKAFQLTNAFLVVILFCRLIYSEKINLKEKYWLILILFFSPLWLYISWSSPPVYSFVFFSLGLVDTWERKWARACLFIAFASLQNPPIAIAIVAVILMQINTEKKLDKKILYSVICGSLSIMPFLFYWIHFRVFSLIGARATSVHSITIHKILSLFLDPNFGLLIYCPLLFIVLCYLVVRREKNAVMMLVLMLLMAAAFSIQLNWNSGMMYINRYSYWLIPPLIFGTLSFFVTVNIRKLVVFSLIYILTTGLVTVICMKQYNVDNYLQFSPLSHALLATVPSLYNPPPEVFAERALGMEIPFMDKLPIDVTNSDGQKKVLVYSGGVLKYLNANARLTTDLRVSHLKIYDHGKEIIDSNCRVGFVKGWYTLETGFDGSRLRWTDGNAELLFLCNMESLAHTIKLKIGSFYKNRDCKVLLDNKVIYTGMIPIDPINIEIESPISQGYHHVSIVSLQPGDVPISIKALNSNDMRILAFRVFDVSIR